MQILLKDLIKESTTLTTTDTPMRVQIYCDMDGVLVDMVKGFKEISGGYTPENLKNKFGGDEKVARKEFWKLIGRTPNFWLNLKAMPDAMVLWKFITNNFDSPKPVILSAGQGSTVKQEKTEWINRHLGPGIQVIIASTGAKKREYIIQQDDQLPAGEYVTHVLIDDTQKNIDAWNNVAKHQIAILHKNSADTIKALQPFITK